ncbi:hypothetical protein FGO68_gene14816 [Halteria grandinella]|uniref:Uncharacterized protein n=1 Tax=Halteria grandinella TaxID=5974 RepID=A0A8J8T001_HALGN|nr:hypothetical protein FGO68_gene14816 [Halteria grandinella]
MGETNQKKVKKGHFRERGKHMGPNQLFSVSRNGQIVELYYFLDFDKYNRFLETLFHINALQLLNHN